MGPIIPKKAIPERGPNSNEMASHAVVLFAVVAIRRWGLHLSKRRKQGAPKSASITGPEVD